MKVIIDIPEESIRYANEIPNTYCKWLLSYNDIVRAIKLGIPIPDNATNGEILKTMFPNIEADEAKTNTGGYIEVKYLDTTDKCDATAFRKNWWNAPYKRGNENG